MSTPQQPDLTSALDRLWLQFRPQMEERLSTLEAAAIALATNTLSPEQSTAAASAAHNLAGVLGTFGLTRGTDLGRELEQHYSAAADLAIPGVESTGQIPPLEVAAVTAELRTIIANRNQTL